MPGNALPTAMHPPNFSRPCGSSGSRQEFEAALIHDCNLPPPNSTRQAAPRIATQIDHLPNSRLLHFVLGTILRRQDRFDEALDEFTESSQLMPAFPETHNQLSYFFYRAEDSG